MAPTAGAHHDGCDMDDAQRTAEPMIQPVSPGPVRWATMEMRWDRLTFMHWRYEPAVVQRLLAPGLEVETFDGSAWVGLVPFEMVVSLPKVGAAPWISYFPETNVRTYARAADGTTGVWFLSLDAARLAAVVTARGSYRLPYFWSSMRVARLGSLMTYECRRRWPQPAPAQSEVAVEVGAPFEPAELTDLDHWLTGRWRLYSHSNGILRAAQADHEPWPLHRVTVLHRVDDLVAAAGLPAPAGDPLAHWSPGVGVRVSALRRVR